MRARLQDWMYGLLFVSFVIVVAVITLLVRFVDMLWQGLTDPSI